MLYRKKVNCESVKKIVKRVNFVVGSPIKVNWDGHFTVSIVENCDDDTISMYLAKEIMNK